MSHQPLSRWLSMDRLVISLAKLVILVSVLLLGLSFFVYQPLLLVIPFAAGAGGVLYLRYHPEPTSDPLPWNGRVSSPTLSPRVAGYLPSVVMVGLAALVLSINQVGSRTDPIYLLTGGIGVAIFVQILFVDKDHLSTGLVLTQILVAAVVIRLTALYATPGFVGVDIWTHVTVFVEGIAQEGSLSPLAGDKYIMAPFYHVIGATGALVLGGARHGVYFTLGLFVPLSALFVYASGRLVFPERWALLATAFFAFSGQFIRWGMHIIPTSLGLVFFLTAVYAVTRLFFADAERWAVALLLVSSLAIVFTHQVSTMIGVILLGIAAVVAIVMTLTRLGTTPSSGVRKTLALASVFIVMLATTFVSWARTPFSSGTFLREELAEIRTVFLEDAEFLNLASEEGGTTTIIGGSGQSGTLLAEITPYIELFGFGLLLLLTVIGILYMLHREGWSDLTSTHALTGAILFVLVFGLVLFDVHVFLPGRWLVFLYVSMAILGAGGLYHLSGTGSRRVVFAVFVLVALGYPTTMVVAEKATLDNPAFEDQQNRFVFTEPEIAAVGTISDGNQEYGERIATDHPYVSLFRRAGGYGYDASILELGRDGPEHVDAVVYRDYQSTGPVILHRAASSPGFELSGTVEDNICPYGWNKGYANEDVTYCTPSPLTEGVDR